MRRHNLLKLLSNNCLVIIVRGKLPARRGDVCAKRVSNNDVMCKDKSVIRKAAPTVSISLAL